MKTEKEKMLSGELYDASDAVLTSERKRARSLIHRINVLTAPDTQERDDAIHELFSNMDSTAFITAPIYCDYGYNLYMGHNSYMNFGCVLLDGMPVHIGKNTLVGPNVQFYTASHPTDSELRIQGPEFSVGITVGEDCWIGGSAVILPGITIGDRCIIGAGSVVTKDVPDDSTVGGNPARILKSK